MLADVLLGAPLNVITAGPDLFRAAVAAQGVAVTPVDWQTPWTPPIASPSSDSSLLSQCWWTFAPRSKSSPG